MDVPIGYLADEGSQLAAYLEEVWEENSSPSDSHPQSEAERGVRVKGTSTLPSIAAWNLLSRGRRDKQRIRL